MTVKYRRVDTTLMTQSQSPAGLSRAVSASAELIVARLQQQLRDKDLKLTDIQLEALTSAHQLDNMRDVINRMQVHDYLSSF